MRGLDLSRCALRIFAAAVLAGCGTQPAFGPAGALGQSAAQQAFDLPAAAQTIYFAWHDDAQGELQTYPTSAHGNVVPDVRIAGAKTLLKDPESAFVGVSGGLWTCNLSNSDILGFAPAARGNVAPTTRIAGTNNPLRFCRGVALDSVGRRAAFGIGKSVFVWPTGSNGNVKPTQIISGGRTNLEIPMGLVFDGAGNLFVTSGFARESRITVYARTANGNAAPLRTIIGPETELNESQGMAIGLTGRRLYVTTANAGFGKPGILVFPIEARDDARPEFVITGHKTELVSPKGIAFDAAGFLYVGNNLGSSRGWITVYKPGSKGDVAPVRTIKGSDVDVHGFIAIR
jgi:serine/threonine protein kinase, bacterial